MSIRWLVRGWSAGAALGVVWAGCSGDDPGGLRPAPQTDAAADGGAAGQHWVGGVNDTDIRVGIVGDRSGSARLFFCGGTETYRTATRWVIVELPEPDASFEYDEGGWQIRGRFEGDALVGDLERDGDGGHAFRAEPVAHETLAGLYEGGSQCGRIGLIVTQANPAEEPSAQGACVGAGLPQQVNPILPIAQVGGRIRVRVGEAEAVVREAVPPGR